MSTLDFLSPGVAADTDGFHPVARSSMERRFREAGSAFEERDGWLVPVSVPGDAEHVGAVGLADLSHLGKLEVRTPVSDTAAASLLASVSDTAGAQPLTAVSDTGSVVYPISPRRTLVLCAPSQTGSLHDRLASEHTLVLDVTAQYGILALTGAETATALRRLTHLHHFPSSGDVAHVTAHVLEPSPGTYWIVFPQEFGHHLYAVAADVAAALRGGPVGVDALEGGV